MTDRFFDPLSGVEQPEGYTVWVSDRAATGELIGTHHVSHHFGGPEEAKAEAKEQTAVDWGGAAIEVDNLHVLGVARGNVTLLEWDEG